MQEDAFIDFRVIGNLLAGHGPVYNVGERVEAYSDPLWLFLLAGIREVFRSISLEWLSVFLGLGFTSAGVVLGGRALQKLGGSRGDNLVIPIGLLIFSVVAGVWEYVTGGLEMGLVFCWIGLSFWLLVRTEHIRTSALWCAFVVGLGEVIRPELILMTVVFLVALFLVIHAPGWMGPTSKGRRYGLPLLVAVLLPLLYELWRMAYFALVVSNTALAKSAGSSWWSQGFTYLWNFVSPYTLWLPFILIIPVMAPRVRRWWVVRDRSGVVVLLTPLAAGLVDALYVTSIGGDYMHARLLLPAFFSLCIGLYVEAGQMRTLAAVPVIGILIWSVACAGWLRFDIDHAQLHLVHGISNERDHWVAGTGNPHPVTIADWSRWTVTAEAYHQAAQNAEVKGRQKMFITTNPYFFTVGEFKGTAKTKLPVHLVVNIIQIGSFGLVSGPDVYVFDAQSLANPIGSHFTGQSRGLRPGGKVVPSVWMIARFGTPGERFPASIATPREIAAARMALACPALSSYLHAITAPLSVSRAFSDFTHSLQYTTMSFSSRPVAAEQQLCG